MQPGDLTKEQLDAAFGESDSRLTIAVDFDGTIVEHCYPDIGAPCPGAFEWLRELKRCGVKLILYTMRSDTSKDGPTLTQAVEFCRTHGIEFDHVNENPSQKTWTTSPKVYAHLYIDDAAVGVPLAPARRAGGRPYVNWAALGPILLGRMHAYNDRRRR